MKSFYTHVFSDFEGIYFRGYENGTRIHRKITDYRPSLFVPTNQETPYRSVTGMPVQRMEFASIKKAYEFKRQNEGVAHEYIFGTNRFHFAYMADRFKEPIEFDASLIRKATIDIEVDTSNGFSSPDNPFAPIISITIYFRGKFYVFGLKPYTPSKPNVRYKAFPDEQSMLRRFLAVWNQLDLDVLFGWNTDQYDIPYIVNRLRRLFGAAGANDLSPWKMIKDHSINFKDKQIKTFEFCGISSLDYIDLYRRYQPKSESDALKFVAEEELGETKIEYEGTLHELYTNDYQKFIDYNIQDVALVEKLDAKLKLADMVFATAYDAKCNFADVQQQVRMWDAITFNALKKRKIAVPWGPPEEGKTAKFVGAFVLPSQAGKHKWVVSFDFSSLYPSLIIEHNISPETLLDGLKAFVPEDLVKYDQEGMLSRHTDLAFLQDKNITCSGAGWAFSKDRQGFLPEILGKIFEDRMIYKRKMKEAERNREAATTPEERSKWEYEVAKYNNFQQAKKLQLNSAYGALGSAYFRFFDLKLARSVTLSGRAVLLKVKEELTEKLQTKYNLSYDPIIYGDTDSLYISAKPFVETLQSGLSSEEIVERIDKDYCQKILRTFIDEALEKHRERYNTFTKQLAMIRDVIAEDTIFVSKKRYLMEVWDKEGNRYTKPKRKATGLEMIKSSTPKFCKEWLNAASGVILKGTPEQLDALVAQYRAEFPSISLEKISYPISVNKIEEYEVKLKGQKIITFEESPEDESGPSTQLKKGTPIQVAAAFAYNRFLQQAKLEGKYEQIKSNVRMRYVYLKPDNPFRCHVMGMLEKLPAELNLKPWVDYERQFDKIFLKPLNILLRAARWREISDIPSVMSIFD